MSTHRWLLFIAGCGLASVAVADEPSGASYQLPEGWKEADFLQRDTEVRFRLGFNGYSPGPFSMFTAFAGWQEFSVVAEHGRWTWRDFTIAAGGQVHYGQAWMLSALSQPISNYDDIRFGWQMWDAGASVRASGHYTPLASVDPYVFATLGAGAFRVTSRVRGWTDVEPTRATRATVRGEVGAGVTVPIRRRPGLVVGGELRYLLTSQVGRDTELDLTRGEQLATFRFYPLHKPPKGFSWVFHVGFRF